MNHAGRARDSGFAATGRFWATRLRRMSSLAAIVERRELEKPRRSLVIITVTVIIVIAIIAIIVAFIFTFISTILIFISSFTLTTALIPGENDV